MTAPFFRLVCWRCGLLHNVPSPDVRVFRLHCDMQNGFTAGYFWRMRNECCNGHPVGNLKSLRDNIEFGVSTTILGAVTRA